MEEKLKLLTEENNRLVKRNQELEFARNSWEQDCRKECKKVQSLIDYILKIEDDLIASRNWCNQFTDPQIEGGISVNCRNFFNDALRIVRRAKKRAIGY
jgi:hypothetical protein